MDWVFKIERLLKTLSIYVQPGSALNAMQSFGWQSGKFKN